MVPNRSGDKPCWQCKGPRTYHAGHDSYCCEYCDIWLESSCDDASNCGFCKDKPRKPSAAEKTVPVAAVSAVVEHRVAK